MIQAEINRGISGAMLYLKVDGEEKREDFRYAMLHHNEIQGILKMQRGYEEGKATYHLDISGKLSLRKKYRKVPMGYEVVHTVLVDIFTILKQAKDYLLEENGFVLDPQYIFTKKEEECIELCYFPEVTVNSRTQLTTFMEYLMNHIDQKEDNVVRLVYDMYHMVREESCSIYQMLQVLAERAFQKESVEQNRGSNTICEVVKEEKKEIKVEEKVEKKAVKHINFSKLAILLGSIVVWAAVFVALYETGFLFKKVGTQLDVSKVLGVALLAVVCEGYLLWKTKISLK